MTARRMLSSCLMAFGASAPVPQDLERVLLLVRAGDFTRAAELAKTLEAPLEHAQAIVYLEHHAGNLERALATARAGAERFPEDAFLADQRAYIALSLRRTLESARALEDLRRIAHGPRQPLERRERDLAQLAVYESDLCALELREAQADAASRRARWWVLGGLALCLALAAWSLARTRRRA